VGIGVEQPMVGWGRQLEEEEELVMLMMMLLAVEL